MHVKTKERGFVAMLKRASASAEWRLVMKKNIFKNRILITVLASALVVTPLIGCDSNDSKATETTNETTLSETNSTDKESKKETGTEAKTETETTVTETSAAETLAATEAPVSAETPAPQNTEPETTTAPATTEAPTEKTYDISLLEGKTLMFSVTGGTPTDLLKESYWAESAKQTFAWGTDFTLLGVNCTKNVSVVEPLVNAYISTFGEPCKTYTTEAYGNSYNKCLSWTFAGDGRKVFIDLCLSYTETEMNDILIMVIQ